MFNKKNYLFSSNVPLFVLLSFFSVVNSQNLPKLYPVTKHSSDSYYFDGLKNSTKIYNDYLTVSKFVLKTADKPGFQLIFNELISALEADVTSSPGSCGDSTIKVKDFLERYSKSENGKLIEFVSGASIAWWSNRKEKAADGIEEHLSYNHTASGFIYKDKLFIVDLSLGQFASAYSRVVIMPYEFWLDAVGAVAKTNSFGQVYATKRIFTGTSLSLFEPPYYSDPKLK